LSNSSISSTISGPSSGLEGPLVELLDIFDHLGSLLIGLGDLFDLGGPFIELLDILDLGGPFLNGLELVDLFVHGFEILGLLPIFLGVLHYTPPIGHIRVMAPGPLLLLIARVDISICRAFGEAGTSWPRALTRFA
jgi:hypothetical protein